MRALGMLERLPLAPAPKMKAPMLAARPKQHVWMSARHICDDSLSEIWFGLLQVLTPLPPPPLPAAWRNQHVWFLACYFCDAKLSQCPTDPECLLVPRRKSRRIQLQSICKVGVALS